VKRLLWLVLAALPACGNTYHPEYHPVTSVRYQQQLSYPVSVHPAPGQQVVVAPPSGYAYGMPPPPTLPPLSPPPAEMDPAGMW
jgi:hypothetical protein